MVCVCDPNCIVNGSKIRLRNIHKQAPKKQQTAPTKNRSRFGLCSGCSCHQWICQEIWLYFCSSLHTWWCDTKDDTKDEDKDQRRQRQNQTAATKGRNDVNKQERTSLGSGFDASLALLCDVTSVFLTRDVATKTTAFVDSAWQGGSAVSNETKGDRQATRVAVAKQENKRRRRAVRSARVTKSWKNRESEILSEKFIVTTSQVKHGRWNVLSLDLLLLFSLGAMPQQTRQTHSAQQGQVEQKTQRDFSPEKVKRQRKKQNTTDHRKATNQSISWAN